MRTIPDMRVQPNVRFHYPSTTGHIIDIRAQSNFKPQLERALPDMNSVKRIKQEVEIKTN